MFRATVGERTRDAAIHGTTMSMFAYMSNNNA